MRLRFALTAFLVVLILPLVAEAQLFRRWRPAYTGHCVNGQCGVQKTAPKAQPKGEAPEPDIPLPTVDGRRWTVTFVYSPKPTKAEVAVAQWLYGHPALKDVIHRARLFPLRTDNPHYTAKDAKGVCWRDFVRDLTPAVIVQDPLGNRVYTTLGFRGEAIPLNGSPISPLPESPEGLTAGIKRAVRSWRGFNERIGKLATAKPRAEVEFPPEEILTAKGPEAAPWLPIVKRLFPKLYERRQQWYQYRQDQKEDDQQEEEADTDVSVEVADIANDFDLPFEAPVADEPVVASAGGAPPWAVPLAIVGFVLSIVIGVGGRFVRGFRSAID